MYAVGVGVEVGAGDPPFLLGPVEAAETVDRALEEVLRADLRRRLAERVRSGEGIDRGEEVLRESRRWRR